MLPKRVPLQLEPSHPILAVVKMVRNVVVVGYQREGRKVELAAQPKRILSAQSFICLTSAAGHRAAVSGIRKLGEQDPPHHLDTAHTPRMADRRGLPQDERHIRVDSPDPRVPTRMSSLSSEGVLVRYILVCRVRYEEEERMKGLCKGG